jgi:hypothetical protein
VLDGAEAGISVVGTVSVTAGSPRWDATDARRGV